jgi:hypothetical protein
MGLAMKTIIYITEPSTGAAWIMVAAYPQNKFPQKKIY